MNNNQIQLKVKEQSGDKNKGGDDTITVRRRCLDIIRTLIEEKIQGISDVNVVIRFLMSQQSSHSNYIVSLINSVSTVEHNRQALIGGLDGIETLHRMLRAKAMIQNQASLINQTETNKDQEINEHERILHELTITMLEQGEKEEIDAQMFNYFVREPKAGVNQALRRLGKELELLPTA
ncbi:MAG: hypothetical protein EZS28_004785 [Streblomastix strix]|uniref:Uncharacterized protein n=1 Tax=Streblomastix strix TaxID=222440 RepID=A0A5J4WZB4_9EUKA|nr:MAG: hypothetical protein EZS28_004785 [Streblomastix strix]